MMNEMTVRELIKLLQSVPADLPVVVDSYEGGLDPIIDVKEIEVIPYPERKSYYGIYDQIPHLQTCLENLLKTQRGGD